MSVRGALALLVAYVALGVGRLVAGALVGAGAAELVTVIALGAVAAGAAVLIGSLKAPTGPADSSTVRHSPETPTTERH